MDVTGAKCRGWRQWGAAIVETTIALPLLIVVILAAIQFGWVYQAKATLNHAALQAARAGAVENAAPQAIRLGLARGLAPLRSPDASLRGVTESVARFEGELLTDARIRILNPTREAFDDFAVEVDGVRELPNDRLHVLDTALGASGGLNVQDANLLRVEITYGYELKVPLVNGLLSRLSLVGERDAFHQQLLRRQRLPIVATATVRMQSPLRSSELLVSRDDLPEVERVVAGSGSPSGGANNNNAETETDQVSSSPGSAGGSRLNQGFFGFGSGEATAASSGADSDGETDTGSDQETDADSGTGASNPSTDGPLCTVAAADPSPAAEDPTALGRVWAELRDLAADAYEFVRGFWDGLQDQIGDLVAAITDPVETARGIYELAMAFMDDPVGTAQTIGAALGHDLSQLVECGAYDRGRVLGSYVSPAFMLKLASKLARFGRAGLRAAADATRRELGCASFAADTAVWVGGRSVSIQSLAVGDWVDSRNELSLVDRSQRVTRLFARDVAAYHVVETEASRFVVTEEHPFWVQGLGWTAIRDIVAGSPIATAFGDTLVVSNQRVDAALRVFNLSVANDSSYFVGDERVWSHNATCTLRVAYHPPRSPSRFALGASDGGPGVWSSISRPETDAYRYQSRITGAPHGVEYNVNGVNFDGYDAQRDVLLDAKHWTQECPLGDRCRFEPLKQAMADKLVEEARRQLDATSASGTAIEWRVVDEEMALRISAILDSRIRSRSARQRITVIYTPLSDIQG
ncbi:TadE/TadG family type IV pilus assembly protein [Steroidobacter sp.]|uniref:TadE/TadG family type IV pilus assembly protein n=1 Tax=Steroidobacter sp. TaxID=1978227 RepID=UPI001A59E533|nr:Tox-REase-5 domain-containing protein [Steroidobacter sp.]MBL8270590.1 pilus assembly protein [Steroidobacter sp.]